MSCFSDVKINTPVWHPMYGDGTVIGNSKGEPSIEVEFSNGRYGRFRRDGRLYINDAAPTLFYEKPSFYKVKVKRIVEKFGAYDVKNDKFYITRDITEEIERNSKLYPAKSIITYEEE